jgi:hypothetical protein
MKMKFEMKVMLAVATLSCAPLGMAGNKPAYANDKVAEFVVQKLDVTSLPSAIRPKKEKGKKTFADYGFTTQQKDDNQAFVEAPGGTRKVSIKVLEQGPSGIYVCVAEPGQNGEAKTQSVILLKRKDSNALLKGRESRREFASCPVIGGTDTDSASSAYGD